MNTHRLGRPVFQLTSRCSAAQNCWCEAAREPCTRRCCVDLCVRLRGALLQRVGSRLAPRQQLDSPKSIAARSLSEQVTDGMGCLECTFVSYCDKAAVEWCDLVLCTPSLLPPLHTQVVSHVASCHPLQPRKRSGRLTKTTMSWYGWAVVGARPKY